MQKTIDHHYEKLSSKSFQIPTVGFNMRKISKGNVTIKLWDIGGQPRWSLMMVMVVVMVMMVAPFFIITAVVIVIAFWLLLSILVFVDSARCGNVTVAVSTPLSIWSMLLIRIRLRCRYHQHHNCHHHYILLSPSLWASPTSSS